MMRFVHHVHVYRSQLLLTLALGVVIAILLYPSRVTEPPYSVEYVHSALVFGEILLPALVGWLTASLVLRDSFLEVVLTTPFRQAKLTLERLIVLVIGAAIAWTIFLTFIWFLAGRPGVYFAELILANVSATFLFGAIGLWCSLRLRTWIGAGLFVTLFWGSGLVLRQIWMSFPLFYPFLTYYGGDLLGQSVWWMNRFILVGVSALFIIDSCRLVNNEEPLLTAFLSEDS